MKRRFNGQYWMEHVTNRVRPNFERFGEIVRSRILPVFDNIDQEATDLRRRCYKEMAENVEIRDQSDSWDAADAISDLAFEEAADHHEVLSSMKSATLNLYTAGIYHLYEQHVVDLCAKILDYHGPAELKPQQAVEWFKKQLGLDLELLPSWKTMNELRLLANVVKHGAGRSADELRQLRPDLFVHPSLRDKGLRSSSTRVRKPLFGEGIYVTLEAFEHYHAQSVAFWDECAALLASGSGSADAGSR